MRKALKAGLCNYLGEIRAPLAATVSGNPENPGAASRRTRTCFREWRRRRQMTIRFMPDGGVLPIAVLVAGVTGLLGAKR